MIEIGVNMKSFCKNYHQFYYSGHLGRSFKLIRARALVSSVNLNLPINAKNTLDFQVMTQNDLKKGLGLCYMKIGHTYERSSSLAFKVSKLRAVNVYRHL
jgi:hypothetical protein